MTRAEAHQLLGLAPGCSDLELTRRFRYLAQQTHPDVGGSAELFSVLAQAYSVAAQAHVPSGTDVVVTTHITSLGGRLRHLRRRVQQRRPQLITSHHPTYSTGGHK